MELNHHRAGAGEPLVLIHGIGHRWQGWRPVIERLAPHREVIALDLPGFAGSPMPPPGTPAGIDALSTLVAEFLNGLGLTHPHVAGNSLGGWISLELAKRGLVRTATGLSPAGFHNRAEGVFQRSSLWLAARASRLALRRGTSLLSRPRVRSLAFAQLAAHPERIPVSELAPTVWDLAQAPWFDETLAAINRLPFSGGEQIDVPVTIAWGERDRLLLPHQARRAARAIPHAHVLTLWGCGHVPTYDDPGQVAEVLLQATSG